MPALDDTDLEILALLAEDARRPYAEIADRVDLSGPAVSERVTRLQEAGVIQRFTVDLDRSQLRAGTPVLVELAVGGDADPIALRDGLAADDAVEHTFVTADGDLVCFARPPDGSVRRWLVERLDDLDDPATVDVDVRVVDEAAWHPSLDGTTFALTCAECVNTVGSEGESATLGGERYHFCCGSCRELFVERYETIEAGA